MVRNVLNTSMMLHTNLLDLLIVCCCDVLVTDRISSVVINGEHHVELEQVHKLNEQAHCTTEAEAVSKILTRAHSPERCVYTYARVLVSCMSASAKCPQAFEIDVGNVDGGAARSKLEEEDRKESRKKQLLEHWGTILEEITADPSLSVAHASWLCHSAP